jgi:hypothetical protein
MNPGLPNPPSAGPETGALTVKPAATESDSIHEQLAEQKDVNLRLAADFENFKRRSRQESEVRAAAQKESFIHELLPAIDNLERALASGASSGSAVKGFPPEGPSAAIFTSGSPSRFRHGSAKRLSVCGNGWRQNPPSIRGGTPEQTILPKLNPK